MFPNENQTLETHQRTFIESQKNLRTFSIRFSPSDWPHTCRHCWSFHKFPSAFYHLHHNSSTLTYYENSYHTKNFAIFIQWCVVYGLAVKYPLIRQLCAAVRSPLNSKCWQACKCFLQVAQAFCGLWLNGFSPMLSEAAFWLDGLFLWHYDIL